MLRNSAENQLYHRRGRRQGQRVERDDRPPESYWRHAAQFAYNRGQEKHAHLPRPQHANEAVEKARQILLREEGRGRRVLPRNSLMSLRRAGGATRRNPGAAAIWGAPLPCPTDQGDEPMDYCIICERKISDKYNCD